MKKKRKRKRSRGADEGSYTCPSCGESIVIPLDRSGGIEQCYVEDCPVCCQPWRVTVRYGHDGHAAVRVQPLDQ